ncbi:MAG: cytochrome C [Gammaproteobacteria bacterium]|nr:cytochrome C [Gammaproteobacteria bacterium]|tara:strand:+ start:3932 stop:4249 length:318 start_codon:yes stop_codon:yes gene_type:complete
MKSIVISIFIILLTGIVNNLALADDIAEGKAKSETCLGCHAIPGYNNVYPTYKVPKIGGQHAGYIEIALKAYRNNERTHGTMHANAAALSDKDIKQIANYFESIK